MEAEYTIRRAGSGDAAVIVAFTRQEVREAEGVEKNPAGIERGVRRAIEEPGLATYWVAEDRTRAVVASISVVTEWSDFHGGHYWWIQSLFILPDHRGTGLVERLIDHVDAAAAEAGALELRLYAHDSNARALHVYRRCGFEVAPYVVMRRPLRARGRPTPEARAERAP